MICSRDNSRKSRIAGPTLAALPGPTDRLEVIYDFEAPPPDVNLDEFEAPLIGRDEELGIVRVTFRRSTGSTMPMTWGVMKPVVLMPAEADAWPEDRLRIVLLHELAHVKRADCLTHLLAQTACAVYWINPLSWIAARRATITTQRSAPPRSAANGMPTRTVTAASELKGRAS